MRGPKKERAPAVAAATPFRDTEQLCATKYSVRSANYIRVSHAR